jgi:hypothetical protein
MAVAAATAALRPPRLRCSNLSAPGLEQKKNQQQEPQKQGQPTLLLRLALLL